MEEKNSKYDFHSATTDQLSCQNSRPSSSDVVLEDRPWPRGSSRTKDHVLGLGLGLEGPGLDCMHENLFSRMFCVDAFLKNVRFSFAYLFDLFAWLLIIHVRPIYSYFVTIRHLYIYG
jgi:hypothetical protein